MDQKTQKPTTAIKQKTVPFIKPQQFVKPFTGNKFSNRANSGFNPATFKTQHKG